MKVSELIEKLKEFDPNLEVRVFNDEFGDYNDSLGTVTLRVDKWGKREEGKRVPISVVVLET